MMTTCCAILGLVLLVVTNLCIIISFATPYWLEIKEDDLVYQQPAHRGLWAYCDYRECMWIFQRNYDRTSDAIWWKATQALMSCGLALGLLSLMLATMALCCGCKGCNASLAVSILLVLAALSMGGGVVTFGINAHSDQNFKAVVSWDEHDNVKKIFSWSFWLGIAAPVWAILTSIVYCIEGRKSRL
ncbi:transmembrane protein 47-like [Haliotis cracherodii]|uniref:transmembrane protein 47-like n=1 Tax=Haliotis cracherodii TaxID=6455 RepID=UPI0039EA4650